MLRAEQPFDILLCDQCLPKVSGIDLIKIASHRGMIKQAILLSSLTSTELGELEMMAIAQWTAITGLLDKTFETMRTRVAY